MNELMKHWLLTIRDTLPLSRQIQDATTHLDETMQWLCRAQDVTGGGGVARSYALRWMRAHKRRGWLGAYPETTGYIIPTFFACAAFTGEETYRDRAIQMAHWESDIQMPSGAVRGGTVDFPPTPAVFNTGQVLFGWACAYLETGEDRFLSSLHRAADFLVEAQDTDGSWRDHGSQFARPGVNLYDARTAWGMLEAFQVTKEQRYREAAVRNLDFVLSRQHPNGWFPDCCLDDNAHPLLHTLAYTMEGLLEAGVLLEDNRYLEAAHRGADTLRVLQRSDGSLAGRFNAMWQPVARWSCLTGDAQTAIVWLRLFQLTGEPEYLEAAQRINRFLMRTQDLTSPDSGIRGGIKGSHPIWAEYGSYEYLNWAAKFFADALLLELTILKEQTVV